MIISSKCLLKSVAESISHQKTSNSLHPVHPTMLNPLMPPQVFGSQLLTDYREGENACGASAATGESGKHRTLGLFDR
jgi:hypothetical protein